MSAPICTSCYAESLSDDERSTRVAQYINRSERLHLCGRHEQMLTDATAGLLAAARPADPDQDGGGRA
ncbi:MAG: hypothetical protein JWO46_745 [Nocardioidaceae bacterium]|nr:hypothetical protein [Nocardioidaceae bacterium]